MKWIITVFICAFAFLATFGSVHAISGQSLETDSMVSLESSVSTTPKPEYVLPYPGILPDHPLYNLKRFRDYILERLITDPVKKTEFYILQADKRLQMGIALTVKGNASLAESTISKGEKYLSKALSISLGYKASGADVPPFVIENLNNALEKHEEVLTTLVAGASDTEKAGLQESLDLIKKMKEEVSELR